MKITEPITLFWFRRDLRLEDNPGLLQALTAGRPVLPVFIFDQYPPAHLPDPASRRIAFIYQTLGELNQQLHQFGTALLVRHGDPAAVLTELAETYPVAAVYANRDYEPSGQARDGQIRDLLQARSIPFRTWKDHVIFEQHEVVKADQQPYTVFTPYKNKWLGRLQPTDWASYPSEQFGARFLSVDLPPLPTLADLGYRPSDTLFPAKVIREDLRQYDQTRDYPALAGTSRLSVHLRFGTVSIRALVKAAREMNSTWLNELIWRDFYHMILFHFPHVAEGAFKKRYDHIVWRNPEDLFAQWCAGQTGYPLVDAGMRELNATGFMHNRVRMVTASFLTKHLLVDWRWGEAYFAEKLLDYDLAANNGGWQWAAGSGCDAAPYFRIFNPQTQARRFDPQKVYIRKWVPELDSPDYPAPIVVHETARQQALAHYKAALANPVLFPGKG